MLHKGGVLIQYDRCLYYIEGEPRDRPGSKPLSFFAAILHSSSSLLGEQVFPLSTCLWISFPFPVFKGHRILEKEGTFEAILYPLMKRACLRKVKEQLYLVLPGVWSWVSWLLTHLQTELYWGGELCHLVRQREDMHVGNLAHLLPKPSPHSVLTFKGVWHLFNRFQNRCITCN